MKPAILPARRNRPASWHSRISAGLDPIYVPRPKNCAASDYRAAGLPVPDLPPLGNAFKVHWELFLRHVRDGAPYPWDFAMAAGGIELAEACYRSCANHTRETLSATG